MRNKWQPRHYLGGQRAVVGTNRFKERDNLWMCAFDDAMYERGVEPNEADAIFSLAFSIIKDTEYDYGN